MIPTLADVKTHLRVQHDEEDALITEYIAAAVESVEAFTRRVYTGDDAEDMPAAGRHAVRLLVGHFYENRQATGAPEGVDALLWPLRRNIYPRDAGS